MEIYPFISYLKKMMFRKATADELKSQLDKDLSELKFHEERIKFLDEIKKLGNDRNLDAYYKGDILDFFDYAECKYEVEKNTINTIVDWSWLYNVLTGKYIKDISLNDFNEVMTYKRLPNGKWKIKWFGKKSEAVYFQDYFKFSMKQFNECFVFNDGKRFSENNRLTTNPEQSFFDMLTKHKQQ